MKKKIIIIGLILLGILILVIFFYNREESGNNISLPQIETIMLNEQEKEIVSELQALKNSLQNPQVSEETNSENSESDTTELIMTPTEPIELKDFCKGIYEVRKLVSEEGKVFFIFDMDTKFEEEIVRRKIVTQNGILVYYTLTEADYNPTTNSESSEDGLYISFDNEFYKFFMEEITKAIEEMWSKAVTFENINYNTILNNI